MIYGVGTVSLDDVTYGVLSTGVIPNGRRLRTMARGRNLGPLSIPAAWTNCVTLTSMAVTAGDWVQILAVIQATMGGVLGVNSFQIDRGAGTATIEFAYDRRDLIDHIPYVPANSNVGKTIYGIGRVTVGGTLIPELNAHSTGSNLAIAAADAQLTANVLW